MQLIYNTSNGTVVGYIFDYQSFELMKNNWPGVTTGVINIDFDVNFKDEKIWKHTVNLETLEVELFV